MTYYPFSVVQRYTMELTGLAKIATLAKHPKPKPSFADSLLEGLYGQGGREGAIFTNKGDIIVNECGSVSPLLHLFTISKCFVQL